MIVAEDAGLGRRPDIYGPQASSEMFGFGEPGPQSTLPGVRYAPEGSEMFGLGALAIQAHVPLLVGSVAAFVAGSAMMIFGTKPGVIFIGDVLSFLGLIGGIASVRTMNQ